MGIVHAEYQHAPVDPELEHALQFAPQGFPVFRQKIERIDILVFLGWILRVPDGAVGPLLKPVGVLADPGMIRGSLEGNVDGHMQVQFPGLRHEPVEGIQPAQIGMHGLVPARLGADSPGAARFARAGFRRIILAFPVRMSDRMYGGQVYDVEPELLDARQQLRRIVERGVGRVVFPAVFPLGRGAGEKFVPCGKAGQHGAYQHGVRVALDHAPTRIVVLHKRNHLILQRGFRVARFHRFGVAQQRFPVLAPGNLRRSLEKPCAHEEFAFDLRVIAFNPARKPVSPCRKGIRPCPYPKKPRSQPVQCPRGEIFVVVAQRHAVDRFLFVLFVANKEFCGNALVALGNQVGLDDHFVSQKPAHGPSAPVRLRR